MQPHREKVRRHGGTETEIAPPRNVMRYDAERGTYFYADGRPAPAIPVTDRTPALWEVI
jgi:hypothetical protein